MDRSANKFRVRFGRLGLGFVLLAAFGCDGGRERVQALPDGSSPADGAVGADAGTTTDPRCAPSPYTGHACGAEAVGASCIGSVSCACGTTLDDFRTFPTPCECQTGGAFGTAYACEDECIANCASVTDGGGTDAGSTDAGVRDAGPPSECGSYCTRATAEGCPIEDCLSQCEASLTGDCGAVWGAYVACASAAPELCFMGVPLPQSGCEEETDALLACSP